MESEGVRSGEKRIIGELAKQLKMIVEKYPRVAS